MRGAGTHSLKAELAFPLTCSAPVKPECGTRTSRILLGKWGETLGVEGRTFTEECGDRARVGVFVDEAIGVEAVSMLLDDKEEVLEWEWAW